MPDNLLTESRQRAVERYPGDDPITAGVWGGAAGGLFGWMLTDIPKTFFKHRQDDGKAFGVFAKIGEFLSKETIVSRIGMGAVIGIPLGFLAKYSYDLAKDRRAHYDTVMSERSEMQGQLVQAGQVIQAIQAENDALKHEVGEGRKRFAEGLKSHASGEHGSHVDALKAHGHEHKEHTSHADAVGHAEHASHAEQHTHKEHASHAEAHLAEQASAEHAGLER